MRGNSDIETLFIYEYLKLRQNSIKQKSTGSAQPHVYPNQISPLEIYMPSDKEKGILTRLFLPMSEKQAEIVQEIEVLTNLREFLIPLLISGQAKIRD